MNDSSHGAHYSRKVGDSKKSFDNQLAIVEFVLSPHIDDLDRRSFHLKKEIDWLKVTEKWFRIIFITRG